MKQWLKVIPEADQATYKRAGFTSGGAFGERPALLVIDVTLGFTGSPGLTLEQAIEQYSPACGPISWETMPAIASLIGTFRKLGRPIIYTRSELASIEFTGKATKAKRSGPPRAGFNDFPEAIAPRPDEWVLEKVKASAFFGAPLATCLVQQKVDSVVVCGVSTSGCVRASVVDCFSHGFPTFVVEDACFDRSWFAHCANLFDMSAKYATVLSLDELRELLGVQSAPDTGQTGRRKSSVS